MAWILGLQLCDTALRTLRFIALRYAAYVLHMFHVKTVALRCVRND